VFEVPDLGVFFLMDNRISFLTGRNGIFKGPSADVGLTAWQKCKPKKMDIIFDTNPYRYLAAGRSYGQRLDLVYAIKRTERGQGIVCWAAPTVWLELFNHGRWGYEKGGDCRRDR
jgi:hypothetical protein